MFPELSESAQQEGGLRLFFWQRSGGLVPHGCSHLGGRVTHLAGCILVGKRKGRVKAGKLCASILGPDSSRCIGHSLHVSTKAGLHPAARGTEENAVPTVADRLDSSSYWGSSTYHMVAQFHPGHGGPPHTAAASHGSL